MFLKSRRFFLKIYWRLQDLIVPNLLHSQDLYGDFLQNLVHNDTCWLEVGCGDQVLPSWNLRKEKAIVGSCKEVVGVDRKASSLTGHKTIHLLVSGDITDLPFKNNIFDLVTANMVVEHLDKPERQFAEINRVLKRNGLFVFHTMNVYGYTALLSRYSPMRVKNLLLGIFEGRTEDEIFPTFYVANTPQRVHALAKQTNFAVDRLRMIASTAKSVILPPLAVLELLWIRLSLFRFFRPLRTNMIAVLKKL